MKSNVLLTNFKEQEHAHIKSDNDDVNVAMKSNFLTCFKEQKHAN